jgi:conjugative transfer signal peptidase TraF
MTPRGQMRWRVLTRLVGSAFVAGALSAAAMFGGYRLNLTASEPLGLWRIEQMDRAATIGDLVFVCPPQTPLFAEARRRLYLARGLCPGGVAPLIKMVAALPGQHVEIDRRVEIDGRPLPLSTVRQKDGAGRLLEPYPGGVVAAGMLYLHSPFKSSYDSRYFGPVPANGMLGLARPILTLDP